MLIELVTLGQEAELRYEEELPENHGATTQAADNNTAADEDLF